MSRAPKRGRGGAVMAGSPAPPPMPPEPEGDPAIRGEILRRLRELVEQQQQHNLATAVALAQQAASGHGPLVEHFAELGRRFAEYVHAPKTPPRRVFEVIEGGAA